MRAFVRALYVVCATGGVVHADLATGRDKLIAGDYKTAIAELAKVGGKDRPAARLLLAQAYAITGDYANASSTVLPLAQGKDATAVEAHLLLDDVRFATGHGAEARKDLEQLYKDHPDDRAVRTALATLRYDQGDLAGAKALFGETIKEFDTHAKTLDFNDPLQLVQLAEAARYTSNFELANDTYRAALKLRPQLICSRRSTPPRSRARRSRRCSRSTRTSPTRTPRWRA
jgi:tetratricopeptide (TPR) repeat protein